MANSPASCLFFYENLLQREKFTDHLKKFVRFLPFRKQFVIFVMIPKMRPLQSGHFWKLNENTHTNT